MASDQGLHCLPLIQQFPADQQLVKCIFSHLSQCTTKPTIRRATSEDSDQPAHLRCLIRVFADRMHLLQPLDYPKRYEQEPLPYRVDIQAYLSLTVGFFGRSLAHLRTILIRSLMSEYLD